MNDIGYKLNSYKNKNGMTYGQLTRELREFNPSIDVTSMAVHKWCNLKTVPHSIHRHKLEKFLSRKGE